MKKWAIATAVCMALTAFPFVSVKGETPAVLPAKAAGRTYADVLESIINDQHYGTTSFNLGSGYSVSDNGFSLYDVDEDGQDELIIWWDHTTMAGMMGVIYDKDASGNIFQKFVGSPYMAFCANGVMLVTEKSNQGSLTNDPDVFLPHSFYRSTSPTGKYELLCSVNAWSKDYRATDYNGNPFPTSVDKSNTGYVYYVSTPGSTTKQPLDYEDYLDKVGSLTGELIPLEDIQDYDLTMQNVRNYCKDVQVPVETQPTTTQTTTTTTSTTKTTTTTTTTTTTSTTVTPTRPTTPTTPTTPTIPADMPAIEIEQVTVTLDQLKAANYQVPVMIKIMHNPGVNALEFGVRCDLEYTTITESEEVRAYADLPTASDSVADGLDFWMTPKVSTVEPGLTWMWGADRDSVESRENIAMLLVTVPEDAKPGDKFPIYYSSIGAGGASKHIFQVKANGTTVDYIADGNFVGLDGFIAIEDTGATTVTEEPEQPQSYRCGDVNDDNEIDIMDVILVNKYLLGTAELSAQGKASADADANGIIDTTDSLLIIKYVVELIETLPMGKSS